jgi:hypothetical protein
VSDPAFMSVSDRAGVSAVKGAERTEGEAEHTGAVLHANERAAEIASRLLTTPIAVRAMAIVQVSVFDAVQSITGAHRPMILTPAASPEASLEAAVEAATRTALLALVPAESLAIEAEYAAALMRLPDGKPKADGIAAGEGAAKAVTACSRQRHLAARPRRDYRDRWTEQRPSHR